MHNAELSDIIEILKEELNNYKFYIKTQPVQFAVVETTGWFMHLYPSLYIQSFESLLHISIYYILEDELIFALV